MLDNRTQKAADFFADVIVFKGKFIANGELEIWNFTDNILIGRLDPFIPVNMFYAGDKVLFEEEEKWRKIAISRKVLK